MKKISAHSKNKSLFNGNDLCSAFSGTSSAACIRIFAAAKTIIYRLRNGVIYKRSQLPSVKFWKTVTEPQKALSHCFLMDRFRTISSNGTMTVPGNSVPIHRLPIKWNLHYTKQRTPDREPLLSITPQMIYRFTRLIWFFPLLKIVLLYVYALTVKIPSIESIKCEVTRASLDISSEFKTL